MPTAVELSIYELGIRVEQALRLVRGGCDYHAVHRGVQRLERAVRDVRSLAASQSAGDRLGQRAEAALRIVERTSNKQHPDRMDEVYTHCAAELSTAYDIAAAWMASRAGPEVSFDDWFQLGTEIVRGEAGDPPKPTPKPRDCVPWQWDEPAKVAELLRSVGLHQSEVFPAVAPNAEWFDFTAVRWADWVRIEAGLTSLKDGMQQEYDPITSAIPILSETEQQIVDVLRASGRRMVTDEILQAMLLQYRKRGQSSIKQSLASLVRRKILDTKEGGNPRGYGLLT